MRVRFEMLRHYAIERRHGGGERRTRFHAGAHGGEHLVTRSM